MITPSSPQPEVQHQRKIERLIRQYTIGGIIGMIALILFLAAVAHFQSIDMTAGCFH